MSADNDKNFVKQRILEAGKERIVKFGYRNLRIDDITNDLQISKRTLYELFSSKEELVKEIFMQSHQKFINEIAFEVNRIIIDDDINFLLELRSLWAIIKKHTAVISNELFAEIKTIFPDLTCQSNEFEETMKSYFNQVYQKGLKLGLIKTSMRSEIFFLIHFHALHSILKPEIISQIPLSINEVLEGAFSVLLTGVLTEDAQKEYLSLSEIQN